MPTVRNMDGSIGDAHPTRWIAPATLPVCKSAQVFDGGADREDESRRLEAWGEPGKPWPFLYVYREGRCFINTAPRRSAYAQAEDVGAALI
jgi:hypothetical protein